MMQMSLDATKEPAKEYEKFKSDANILCITIVCICTIRYSTPIS